MTVEAKDLALRVRRLVESMNGIRRCRADAPGGEIEFIEVIAEPGRVPEALVREIRGALLAYLGRSVTADQIHVEVADEPVDREPHPEPHREPVDQERDREPDREPVDREPHPEPDREPERREPEHLRGPEELGPPARAFPAGQEPFWERGNAGPPSPPTPPSPPSPPSLSEGDRSEGAAPESASRRAPTSPGEDAPRVPGEIRLGEYRIVGGRGPGVEVQVSVVDGNGRSFEGAVSADSLAAVRSETFIDATVRAARSMIEEADRSRGRTPTGDLELSGQEDGVRVGDDRFFAVTLELRRVGRRVRGTGFEVMGGKVGADVAIAATLDALQRLVRGEGVRVSEVDAP